MYKVQSIRVHVTCDVSQCFAVELHVSALTAVMLSNCRRRRCSILMVSRILRLSSSVNTHVDSVSNFQAAENTKSVSVADWLLRRDLCVCVLVSNHGVIGYLSGLICKVIN